MTTENGSESGASGPEAAVPRRESELGATARTMIGKTLGEKRPAVVSDPPSRLDMAVAIHGGLQGDNPDFGIFKDVNINFPDQTVTLEGEDYQLDQDNASLGSIHGKTETGDLICSFRNPDGTPVTTSGGDTVLLVPIQPDAVLNAYAFAFKDELGGLIDDEDDNQLFNAYTNSLDQNANPVSPGPETNDLISKTAEKYNMLKVADVKTFIDGLPDQQRNNPDVQDALANLRGGVLVSSEEFKHILELTGNTKDLVKSQHTEAQDELAVLKAEQDSLPADADDQPWREVADKIKAAENKLTLLDHASDALTEPEPEEPQSKTEQSIEFQAIDQALSIRMRELQEQANSLVKEQTHLQTLHQELSPGKVTELESAQHLYTLLDAATSLKGEIGLAARESAMNQALVYAKGEGVTSAGTHQLKRALGEPLRTAKAQSSENLAKRLTDAGIDEDQRKAAQEIFGSPDKLAEFLSGESDNPQINALLKNPEFTKIMYGENDTLAIDTFRAAAEASLTNDQKKLLDRAKKWGGGTLIAGSGLVLLLLALTGASIAFVAKGIAGDSRAA